MALYAKIDRTTRMYLLPIRRLYQLPVTNADGFDKATVLASWGLNKEE